MTAPFETRFNEMRHRVRRLLWLNGLSLIVTVVFGASLLIGFLDWLVHINDPVVRLLFTSGIVIAAGWISWRFLILSIVRPFSNRELAARIERRYPEFKDGLASTVQFSESKTDPRLGSPQLQQKVIDETRAQMDHCDIDDVIETRPAFRAVFSAIAVSLLLSLLVVFCHSSTAIAFHRLVMPFSAVEWPRETVLQFLDSEFHALKQDEQKPLQLARGGTLELFVKDMQGSLPEDVSMQYRFENGESVTERIQQTTLVDPSGRSHDVGVVRFVPKQGTLLFRAIGGDDDVMPWQRLIVVPPPVLQNFQITLTPPAYSGMAPTTLPRGVTHVDGLVGTRIEISADASKPLESGRLHVKEKSLDSLVLDATGRRLNTSFVIQDAGVYSYWFELRDHQDFEDPEAPRYEIRGIADSPPKVYVNSPNSDQTVTADAQIPLEVTAEDDLKLKSLRLQFQIMNVEADQPQTIPLPLARDTPMIADVQTVWDLSQLSLTPGMQIPFYAEAEDFYELNGDSHLGRSISRTLTVVSADEKKSELASRHGELLENIERALKTQLQSHDQVGELKLQLEKAGRLRSEDVDLIRRIELDQKQIQSRLFNSSDGVETIGRRLAGEMKQNNLIDPEMERRLEQIDDELQTLREDSLPQIEQSLTQVRKRAQSGRKTPDRTSVESGRPFQQSTDEVDANRNESTSPASVKPGKQEPNRDPRNEEHETNGKTNDSDSRDPQLADLKKIENHQATAIESLEAMRGQLSRWQNRHALSEELSDLITDQETLNRESTKLGKETLTKSSANLTPQQQADLARLAERQRKQSQRVQKFQQQLSETAENLKMSDSSSSELLNDAGKQLENRKTARSLQDAAERLERNDIAESLQRQQEALDELKEVQDLLQNSGTRDTESLLRKLREAEQSLEQLQRQQEDLLENVKAAQKEPDASQRSAQLKQNQAQQQQLQKETAGTTRQLKRLRAYTPADSTDHAASRMEQAASDLQQHSPQQAAQEQQEAVDDLEQARHELARTRQLAESQQANEMLHRVFDDLRSIAESEQTIIEQTTSLGDQLKGSDNRWSRRLLKIRSTIAVQQTELKQKTERLADQVDALAVFSLGLRGASRMMQVAAERIDQRKIDAITIGLESASRKRLLDLLKAFQTDPSPGDAGQQAAPPNQQGEEQARQQSQRPELPQLIQLKMLKILQQDLISRTVALRQARLENGGDSMALQQELDAIASEQARLADLAQSLTREFVETLEALEEESREEP